MKLVRIVTDSTADIPPEMVDALDIAVVPCYVVFGSESYRDGVELTKEQFYEKLATRPEIPTTATAPPAHYEAVYRRLAEDTDAIVSIHLTAKLSGLYSAASVAAGSVSEARVVVIDSEQVTMGYGWMVVAAAEAAQRGATPEQIAALVRGMVPRSRVLAALGTLDFLHRGGRVDWVRATLGTFLRIKPIVEVRMGTVQLVERARTMERSLERLIKLLQSLGPLERAIVLHTDAPDLAERVADRLEALMPGWSRLITQAGVAIASHAGPGAVGVACVTAK
jgi:DegV family protein with EDD domain